MQTLSSNLNLTAKYGSTSVKSSRPKCDVSRFSGFNRRPTLHVRAQPQDGKGKGSAGLYEPEPDVVKENGSGTSQTQAGAELEKSIGQLPLEQQKQLGRLYMFLTQHPEAKLDVRNFGDVRRALDNYQVLLWRPAELLNGRLAMLGFVAAVANEAITGASLWQQLYYAPYAFFSAYTLVIIAAQLNRAFGSPSKGIGPFTSYAEIINGRAAMVGFVILAYAEYNLELRRAATLLYSQLQQQGSIGL